MHMINISNLMYRGKMRNRIFRKIKTAQEIRESLYHISQAKEVGKAIKTRKKCPNSTGRYFYLSF